MSFGPLGMFGLMTGNPILAVVEQTIRANSESYDESCPGGPLYHQKRKNSEDLGPSTHEKPFLTLKFTCGDIPLRKIDAEKLFEELKKHLGK